MDRLFFIITSFYMIRNFFSTKRNLFQLFWIPSLAFLQFQGQYCVPFTSQYTQLSLLDVCCMEELGNTALTLQSRTVTSLLCIR